MRLIYENRKKRVYKLSNGEEKVIYLNSKFKESVAKGDTLQPYGKDEREFFYRFKDNKKKPNGEIYNRRLDRKNRRDYESEALSEQKDNFKKKYI